MLLFSRTTQILPSGILWIAAERMRRCSHRHRRHQNRLTNAPPSAEDSRALTPCTLNSREGERESGSVAWYLRHPTHIHEEPPVCSRWFLLYCGMRREIVIASFSLARSSELRAAVAGIRYLLL